MFAREASAIPSSPSARSDDPSFSISGVGYGLTFKKKTFNAFAIICLSLFCCLADSPNPELTYKLLHFYQPYKIFTSI